MTTKIGLAGAEVTVRTPDSESYQITSSLVGASERALDGTLRRQSVGLKRTWQVPWLGLSTPEYIVLITELTRNASLSWYPPEGGGPYTVLARDITVSYHSGAHAWTDVSCQLEEV